MNRGLTGYYFPVSIRGETCRAFVPHPLPPTPPLALGPDFTDLYDNAALALGRLDGITLLLPDPALFLYAHVRKEAVLSSQIEGTQSSLSDLLLFEMEGVPGVPMHDVQEVSNYVAALHHVLQTQPLTTIAKAAEALRAAPHTVGQSFDRLIRLGVVREITGARYGRGFAYSQYVDILNEGT